VPGRQPKKTRPTTVRFSTELDAWVREAGAQHYAGQSGVINDAVAAWRELHEKEEVRRAG